MNVLVTGGSGYIGSKLVRRLYNEGHSVTVLDKVVGKVKGAKYVEGDVRYPNDVQRVVYGVDAVVHLAAIVGEEEYEKDKSVGYEVNVVGTTVVVGEAKEAGVKRLILASTGNVYGKVDHMANESETPQPVDRYGYSKLMAEEVVKEGKYVSVRFGTVCGWNEDKMRWDLLPHALLRDLSSGVRFKMYSPEAFRPVTHIDDAVDALLTLASVDPNSALSGKVFNIVSENVSKRLIADWAIALTRFPGVDFVTDKEDKRNYLMDPHLIERTMGWKRKKFLSQAMKEVYRAAC